MVCLEVLILQVREDEPDPIVFLKQLVSQQNKEQRPGGGGNRGQKEEKRRPEMRNEEQQHPPHQPSAFQSRRLSDFPAPPPQDFEFPSAAAAAHADIWTPGIEASIRTYL